VTTSHEIFQKHWDSVQSGDMDAIVRDYAENAVLIRPNQTLAGHEGCRKFFHDLFEELEGFSAQQHSVTVGEATVLLEWRASHADGRTAIGADTFIIENGKIQIQTVAFEIQ
jgi:ketosteroid isomerase-like protein